MTFTVIISRTNQIVDFESETVMGELSFQSLERYVIPDKALPPPGDQRNRGTCWAWASMYVLQSAYRKQGIEMGYLEADEYVDFSVQAHGINIINYCSAHPDECPDTPEKDGKSSTDGYISWLYVFNNYLKDKLVPDMKSCPYTPDPGQDTECPGMKEYLEVNPLRYDFKMFDPIYTVEGVKRTLLKRQHALPLITELIMNQHFVPCSEGYENTDQCINKQYKCPKDQTQYCARLSMMQNTNGHFYYKKNNGLNSGAHAMSIVGFDDNILTFSGDEVIHKGGFIVANWWSPEHSHSVEFLSQKISYRNERYQCPNSHSPFEWMPVGGNGDDIYKLREPTKLSCHFQKNAHFHTLDQDVIRQAIPCEEDKTYILVNKTVVPDSDGLHIACFHVVEDNVDICYPPMLFDLLNFVFQPKQTTDVEGLGDSCGFYVYPYDYFNEVHQRFGMVFSADIEVEFEKSSYLSQQSKYPEFKNGYEKVKEAQHVQNKMKWTQPTPWQQNVSYHPRFNA
eukprot:TRINITY_DN7016_c0_g1_i1.p1 TRINITY_DN7016_c0_g1~~TRINITY_DN7016_c0_g1_i1.p1  ORF type:complete len:558 (+),score=172.60 TRINITY_DN7016_c0_g1_i1:149-1675(+)